MMTTVEPFYSDLQAVGVKTREVAAEGAQRLRERLVDARRILALGRDFVRTAEHDVQQIEAALAAVSTLSGERELAESLRGRRLGHVAVELLRESARPQPIHYTDWFRILEDSGRVIDAKDPMATFLTAITREDVVERVGQRTGMYRLR